MDTFREKLICQCQWLLGCLAQQKGLGEAMFVCRSLRGFKLWLMLHGTDQEGFPRSSCVHHCTAGHTWREQHDGAEDCYIPWTITSDMTQPVWALNSSSRVSHWDMLPIIHGFRCCWVLQLQFYLIKIEFLCLYDYFSPILCACQVRLQPCRYLGLELCAWPTAAVHSHSAGGSLCWSLQRREARGPRGRFSQLSF